MKKCTYCGKEYPDDAVKCIIDHQPLTGGEPEPTEAIEVSVPPLLAVPSETKPLKRAFTDRQMVAFEVIILCAIAFGASIFASWFYLFDKNVYSNSPRSEYAWALQVLHETSCLGLLWYFLARRGKAFSDLGLSWRWKDAGWSVILLFAGGLACWAIYYVIFFTGMTAAAYKATHNNVGHLLFGGGIFFETILIQFVNPFFEELIVRAYVITEVKYLTNSVAKAVIISTVLQTSYHFYQGVPMALSYAGTFLIFSIYYAKTNRIAPIILAHLYMDVSSTFSYWLHH